MPCDAAPTPFSLTIPANPLAVRESLVDIAGFVMRRGYGAAYSADLLIIMGEVLNNIVEHAYAGSSGEIAILLTAVPQGIGVHLTDRGRPMPAGQLPSGGWPVVQPVENYNQPEGGFGWALIRFLARDLSYRREVGQNVLTFFVPLTAE